MSSENYDIIPSLLFAATLVTALGIPLVLGKVPRNAGYGFRLPITLSDDRIWYPVNRSAGWYMVCNGAAILVLSIASLSGLYRGSLLWLSALMMLSALLGTTLGLRKARRLKAKLDAQAHGDEPGAG